MAVLTCDRDRALFEAFVSTGARAAEMLGVCSEDLDWAGQRMWVVSKGSRVRRVVPLSPVAMRWLGCYLDSAGIPPAAMPIWRARRGDQRSLTYSATRRVMQRVNEVIGANWSLHDLRHTAAARMLGSGVLTIAEVQVILGHADLRTTSRYTMPRVEEVCAKLQEYYRSPLSSAAPRMPAGYDPADVAVIFGE
jgi:site-specific recombinase XerC